MTIGERVKYLRKTLDLTMEKFGERLGVGKTAISKIEHGQCNVSDQMSLSICREYGVNEEWLRSGSGEMFVPRSRNEKLIGFVDDVMSDEDDSFRKNFVDALADLEPEDWASIEKFLKKLVKKD